MTSPEVDDRNSNTTKRLSYQASGGALSEALVTEKLGILSSRKDGGCLGEEATDGVRNSEASTKNS